MAISIHFDDIIYQLQRTGGASVFWKEMTSRVACDSIFSVQRTRGSKLARFFPVVSNADLFHSSHFRTAVSRKTKNIATIYDFVYEHGLVKTRGSFLNIWERKRAATTADVLICISEHTKKDLLAFYPQVSQNPHIYVVKLATSLSAEPRMDVCVSKRLVDLKSTLARYILYIGGRLNYKNFNAALMGFAGSALPKQSYSLICIGSRFSAEEEHWLKKLNLQDKAILLEQATEAELKYLYQHAFALVYPSLYEGFGLPVLEAMSCGCPVIASLTSSIPEVVGDAGLLVDSKDASLISEALNRLLDETIRADYIARGKVRAKLFSWDRTAQEHVRIYKSLV